MTISVVPVASLVPHPANPRLGNVELIRESIRANGFYGTVIVQQSTSRICAGAHRWKAAQLEGMTEIPADVLDINDATALRIVAADNRTSDVATYQDALLADLLAEVKLADGGLVGTGFDDGALAELLAEINKPDPWSNRPKAPMPDARGLTSGEVWDVGPHRLVIGDARDPAAWACLPPAHLCVMDPPYGIEYGGGGGLEREAIDGDGSPEEAIALLAAVAGQVVAHARGGAACYTFLACDGDCFPPMLQALAAVGLARWHLVWVKNNATFGRADYQFQHENVAYGWTPANARLRPVENRKLTSVWRVDRPSASKDHPTAKPVEVCAIPIEASSQQGDVVVDPFAGSGSTLVAAAQLGRVATGIELRPEYARVTLDRLEEVTGLSAERAQTSEPVVG